MEDILASIRRILSEDEPEATPPEGADDDVLPLDDSMMVAEPDTAPPDDGAPPDDDAQPDYDAPPDDAAAALITSLSTSGEALEVAPAEPEPAFAPEPAPPPMPPAPPPHAATDRLIAPEAEAATASSVSTLLRTIESGRQSHGIPIYGGGPTLEDMVRDELRALLKAWLDSNLPPLVERLVRTEIERLVGRAVG